jgi:hypothetical protein
MAEAQVKELWDRIYAAFEGHRLATDPNAQAALNASVPSVCIGTSLVAAYAHVSLSRLNAAVEGLSRFREASNRVVNGTGTETGTVGAESSSQNAEVEESIGRGERI